RQELADVALARTAIRGLETLDLPDSLLDTDDVVVPLRRRRNAWAATAAAAMILVGLVVTNGGPAPVADVDTLADQHTARVVIDPGFATIRMTVDE
ncbi:MAG: hypothetical protein GWN07_10930, partial [Actinobacteria bacterium]|nr:hypothetical protein [Actinomycetota bacterium]NIV86865.1 hypothetical protein [Actinomycetota bacterium]NIX20313.1 hypothetical protein [Actinomycetota bacterium]